MAAGVASPAAAQGGGQATAPSPTSPLRVGPNYPLTFPGAIPIYGRDAVSLAVNPRNSRHIVAMYSDYKTLWCEVVVSTDGGRKWRRTRLKAPAGFISPPCTVGSHLANFVDQGIAFGKGNNVYATFASGVLDEQGDSRGKSVLVARSTNGGRSFGVADVVLPGGDDPDVGPDYTLPKLVVKPGTGAAEDRIHVVANSDESEPRANPALADSPRAINRIMVTTSQDSGRTWGGKVSASPSEHTAIESSEIVLGRNDTLYVAWRTRTPQASGTGFEPEGTVVVGRSTDQGQTWTNVPAAGVKGFVYTGPVGAPYSRTPNPFTASTFPRLAADPRSGNVYLTYGNGERPLTQGQVRGADHFIHKDLDVYFQRSTDGGNTWSDPSRLNQQAPIQFEITQTRHPRMSVAPNGRLDVVWQDRRHWYLGPAKETGITGVCTHTHSECDEARIGDTYYRSSANGGASFSRERRITDRHINNDVGYDYRFGAYWDYGPRSIPLGNDRILFAWMDSRDGNTETDDMNIYFAQATLDGSRNIPVRRVRGTSASDLSVRMSRRAFPGGTEGTLAGTFASRPWTRVVIVNERDMPGALAGGVLGRAFVGPVLLTGRGGLSAAVRNEVTRLGPVGAFVIGGEQSLSPQVITDLAAAGVPEGQITRLEGTGAAGTAAAIATAMDRRSAEQKAAGKPAFREAVIVNPASPDAAAISVLAAHRRMPVLFTGANALPTETADALNALNIPRAIVVGSSQFVGAGVMGALPAPQRLSGATAVQTSRLIVAQSRRWGLPENVFFSTNAGRKMDAAVIGAAAARIGGMFVLSSGGATEAGRVINQLKMRSTTDHLVMVESGGSTGR
ncbi:MAG: GH33 [uncultured Solirubrobacteraceae bacterium]|uniref:GH33 n=1 Tax=uncultured Solirubrobacteraceae bacterium TaxID=1162706 RepID=A0A6J4T9M7_9ACTN|nr:MAG: GH33 [uncultured Solirubrobacteraceae bacterium]